MLRILLMTVLGLGVLAGPARADLPPIKHVFVLVLENEDANTTFSDRSPAPYLAKTLPSMGEFVPNYYGIGHLSLDNYVTMISGQAPNPETQADCPIFTDFGPGLPASFGQAIGIGCVYPSQVKTVADQLAAKALTWKGYMEDMGNTPGAPQTCRHPSIGAADSTQSAKPTDGYAARHNPFVYFHSIIDSPDCATNDVPLDRLPGDLASADTTPNLSFITPNLCNDGHDANCADGSTGGLVAVNGFLKTWIPRIVGSPAYKQDGLLVVMFDEASTNDSSACCNEQQGPNTASPGGPNPGPGGGRTGAVLLSPFITPRTTTRVAYNHYSLLRSIEDIFALDHLGYAADPALVPFGSDIYTASPGSAMPGVPQPKTCSPAGRRRRGQQRRRAGGCAVRPPQRHRRRHSRARAKRR